MGCEQSTPSEKAGGKKINVQEFSQNGKTKPNSAIKKNVPSKQGGKRPVSGNKKKPNQSKKVANGKVGPIANGTGHNGNNDNNNPSEDKAFNNRRQSSFMVSIC